MKPDTDRTLDDLIVRAITSDEVWEQVWNSTPLPRGTVIARDLTEAGEQAGRLLAHRIAARASKEAEGAHGDKISEKK